MTTTTEKQRPKQLTHPATFSEAILDMLAAALRRGGHVGMVLDPFAGTGKIHLLAERLGVTTIGVELEPEWAAMHADTIEGNALELTALFALGSIDAIVTSPCYGNRMADHHEAKDDSYRLTYRHSIGHKLHADNSGQLQWGKAYKRFHELAWEQAVAVLKPGGLFILDIKDFKIKGVVQPVAQWHIDTLTGLGLRLGQTDFVLTKGLPAGSNSDKRTEGEYVVTFRKDVVDWL